MRDWLFEEFTTRKDSRGSIGDNGKQKYKERNYTTVKPDKIGRVQFYR